MLKYQITTTIILFLVQLNFGQSSWSYPGCPDVTDADFTYTSIIQRSQQPDANLLEPMKIELYQHPTGEIDIFYTERRGALKIYHGSNQTVSTLHTFDVPWSVGTGGTAENAEDGLIGVELDPNFATNRWIYVYYSVRGADKWRVSRWTLNQNFTDITDENIIIEWDVQMELCCHQGGSMQFDDYGDLWITVGNNEGRGGRANVSGEGGGINEGEKNRSGEWGASSTASFRGGVLRIHPLPDGSYTIPQGNFWEHYADYFDKQGKTALATQYRDSTLVKRELYIKGNRNPFSINLDPTRRWLGYGDVGPDGPHPSGTGLGEEWNLHKEPGFAGWPYFAGTNLNNVGGKNPAAPTNTSQWNTGVQELPPAVMPFDTTRNSAAMAGPIYRYNPNLNSAVKFPPHFHRMWFTVNYSRSQQAFANVVNENTLELVSKQRIFASTSFQGPLAMEMGPDGALYVVHYAGGFSSSNNTRIGKFEYDGPACSGANIVWEYAGCQDQNYQEYDANATHSNPAACISTVPVGQRVIKNVVTHQLITVLNGTNNLFIPLSGYEIKLFDLKGKEIWNLKLTGQSNLTLPNHLANGIYKVQLYQ